MKLGIDNGSKVSPFFGKTLIFRFGAKTVKLQENSGSWDMTPAHANWLKCYLLKESHDYLLLFFWFLWIWFWNLSFRFLLLFYIVLLFITLGPIFLIKFFICWRSVCRLSKTLPQTSVSWLRNYFETLFVFHCANCNSFNVLRYSFFFH